MAITLDQAKALQYGDVLHSEMHKNADGTCQRWKVQGQPKTWKRSPERVSITLKFGLKTYDRLCERDLHLVHLESECPEK